MSYDDAVKNLQEHGSEIQWGGDFGGARRNDPDRSSSTGR